MVQLSNTYYLHPWDTLHTDHFEFQNETQFDVTIDLRGQSILCTWFDELGTLQNTDLLTFDYEAVILLVSRDERINLIVNRIFRRI